jgi:hypothetical protein
LNLERMVNSCQQRQAPSQKQVCQNNSMYSRQAT